MAKNKKNLKIKDSKQMKKIKGEMSEFKKFISRGNVVDMAIGVIIGAAFGKIVTSLVNDILMPAIGVLLGGLDFSDLSVKFRDATIAYGLFIQTIIDFLIISMCVFIMVKVFEKFKIKEEEQPKAKSEDICLLEEIRDLLKEKAK